MAQNLQMQKIFFGFRRFLRVHWWCGSGDLAVVMEARGVLEMSAGAVALAVRAAGPPGTCSCTDDIMAQNLRIQKIFFGFGRFLPVDG